MSKVITPQSLEVLLQLARHTGPVRYLAILYPDGNTSTPRSDRLGETLSLMNMGLVTRFGSREDDTLYELSSKGREYLINLLGNANILLRKS